MGTMRFVHGGLILLLAATLHAGSRESAFQARALLGPDIWSRILRIENNQAGFRSRYPAEFHAVVFAFEGILWFYTGLDGTQSLSLYSGRLAADQADPGPLLRALEPGLTRFTDVTDQARARLGDTAGRPPNDCFIACVAYWQGLQREKEPPARNRLLTFYHSSLHQGHTMLEFWRGGQRLVFDPNEPDRLHELPLRLPDNPLDVAQVIYPHWAGFRPSKAVYFELGAEVLHPANPHPRLQTVRARRNNSSYGSS